LAKEFSERHPNSYYLNLLRNTSFSAKDFRDADHLNSDGAKKLSQMIDLEVNKIIDSLQ